MWGTTHLMDYVAVHPKTINYIIYIIDTYTSWYTQTIKWYKQQKQFGWPFMALPVVFYLQLRCSLSTPFTTEQASDATIIPGIRGVNQNETAYKNTWDSIPGCFSIESVIWKKCELTEYSNTIFSGACHNFICFLFVCIQWIGFRENLQETILIICTIKYGFFLLDFPQKLEYSYIEPITEFLNVCWSNFLVQIWFPPTVLAYGSQP